MKPKLLIVALVIIAADVASIAFLRPIVLLNDKFGFIIIMLQSIFFSLHVIEEFYLPGGGIKWFKLNKTENEEAFTEDYFLKLMQYL